LKKLSKEYKLKKVRQKSAMMMMMIVKKLSNTMKVKRTAMMSMQQTPMNLVLKTMIKLKTMIPKRLTMILKRLAMILGRLTMILRRPAMIPRRLAMIPRRLAMIQKRWTKIQKRSNLKMTIYMMPKPTKPKIQSLITTSAIFSI
jgi:hypothetical protein